MPDAPTIKSADAEPVLKRELDEALALALADPNLGEGCMVCITATAIHCGREKDGTTKVLHLVERSVGKIDNVHTERWGITSVRELGRGVTWKDALRNAKPAAHDYGKGRRVQP